MVSFIRYSWKHKTVMVKNRSAVSQLLAVGRRCDGKVVSSNWGSVTVQYPNDCGGS